MYPQMEDDTLLKSKIFVSAIFQAVIVEQGWIVSRSQYKMAGL